MMICLDLAQFDIFWMRSILEWSQALLEKNDPGHVSASGREKGWVTSLVYMTGSHLCKH